MVHDNLEMMELELELLEFQAWIKTQSHLPQDIDKLLLMRYLYVTKSLEKAQHLLNLSLEMRKSNPHIFTDRNPFSDEIEKVFKIIDMVPLLQTTPQNYKICVFRLTDFDADKFDFNTIIKTFFIMADIRLISPDPKSISDGEVPIFDMKGLTLRHITKVALSTLRLYMKYTQTAHPVHVRQIHVLNCNSYLNKVIAMIKPFMRTEVFKMLNFHAPGSETLYDFVPKDILPEEYGGLAGKMSTLKKYWVKKVYDHRDYLTNESNWQIREVEGKVPQRTSIFNYISFF